VEHPVTEMITGEDLVEWQIRVSSGEPLPKSQDQLRIHGHAFEARIYAEDPDRDFLPSTGTLSYLQPPEESIHVRVDTGVLQGDEVSVYYDPMIAKLVVWDENRDRALARLARALMEYRVSGVSSNISFLYNLALSQPFKEAQLDTHFIEKHRALLFHDSGADRVQDLPLASLFLLLQMEANTRQRAGGNDPGSPWNSSAAWRLNQPSIHTGAIVLNGTEYEVPVEERGNGQQRRFCISVEDKEIMAAGKLSGNTLYADIDGYRQKVEVVPHDGVYTLFGRDGAMQFALAQPDLGQDDGHAEGDAFSAPMHGVVVKLLVDANDAVKQGQPLMVMEAMKMEHTICAPQDGRVKTFYFQAGDQVGGGEELLEFEREP
jgi:3-methylcrotonyl-CoA carboxylase alpha subunit